MLDRPVFKLTEDLVLEVSTQLGNLDAIIIRITVLVVHAADLDLDRAMIGQGAFAGNRRHAVGQGYLRLVGAGRGADLEHVRGLRRRSR